MAGHDRSLQCDVTTVTGESARVDAGASRR
jgi:hypothetical protein